jgi:hypothetical protein
MWVVQVAAVAAVARLLSPRTTSGCSSREVLAVALATAIKLSVLRIRARLVRRLRGTKVESERTETRVRTPTTEVVAVAAVVATWVAQVDRLSTPTSAHGNAKEMAAIEVRTT